MTVFIKWISEYSLGIPEIDKQHQYIFQLANEIQYADISEADYYADRLYNYTKWHFSVEEKYFSETGSPLLLEHMEMHNRLLEGLNAIVQNGLSTEDDFEKLKTHYLKWLVEHILYQDRKIVRELERE